MKYLPDIIGGIGLVLFATALGQAFGIYCAMGTVGLVFMALAYKGSA